MMLTNSSLGNFLIVLATILLIQSTEGFMIAFSCGTTVDLDWIFYCGFIFPPSVDCSQEQSKTFFSPLTLATYVDFINDLTTNTSTYIPKNRDNVNFYQLLWHLHICPYSVESLKSYLPSTHCNPSNSGNAAASILQKNPESLQTPKTINPITKSIDNVPQENKTFDIEKYISFWKRFRYVYPMTTVESFEFYKELGSGTFGTCHWSLAKIGYKPSISLSVSLPYNIAFKKIRELSLIHLNDCVHGSAVDLNELHLSIFNKLNECPFIHNQIGVAVNEFLTGSTEYFAGYVAEVATFGALNAFMDKHRIVSGHVFILEKMLDIARAIDFMHKNEIMHTDIVPRNILVFYLGGGKVAFKLADLGTSCRYELCKSPQKFDDWEEYEDFYRETYPKELFYPESFPQHCSQMDWYMFGCTLKKTVEFLKQDISYAFKTVGYLIVALTEDDYVNLEDAFELVMYSLQTEIEAMMGEVEPQEFSFSLKEQ